MALQVVYKYLIKFMGLVFANALKQLFPVWTMLENKINVIKILITFEWMAPHHEGNALMIQKSARRWDLDLQGFSLERNLQLQRIFQKNFEGFDAVAGEIFSQETVQSVVG